MDTTYKNAYLDAAFGATKHASFPATLYLALFLAGDVEVAGGAYARKAVVNNGGNFGAAAAGEKTNATAVTFVAASAAWGTVVAFKWMDALAAGAVVHAGLLAVPTPINIGDVANFPIGTIIVTAADA